VLLFGLASCTQGSSNTKKAEVQLPFYDLKTYFKNEIDRLNQSNLQVEKVVKINEESEVQQLNDINYEQELKLFTNSDINRMAWFDKYKIDSIFEDRQLKALHYTALDEDLKTKSVQINFSKQEIDQVLIENSTESFIASSMQSLAYQPKSGYQIITSQKTKLGKKQAVSIAVAFE
jgi:ketopantoate reductase